MPGDSGRTRTTSSTGFKWESVTSSCLAIRGQYRHYGKVLGRYQNIRAAHAIWGENAGAEDVREHLFFLTEPISLGLSHEHLNDYLDAERDGFHGLSDEEMAQIDADFDSIEQFLRRRLLNTEVGGPVLDMSGIVRLSEREQARLRTFDAESSKDGRAKTVDTIIKRRGEPTFRHKLLAAYDYHCAFTGCNAPDALEAAYIVPYRGEYTHDVSNGLLLRADLHALFDLGKIAVDTRTMTIIMTDELLNSSYRILVNRPLHCPQEQTMRPSTEGLDLHRRLSGL